MAGTDWCCRGTITRVEGNCVTHTDLVTKTFAAPCVLYLSIYMDLSVRSFPLDFIFIIYTETFSMDWQTACPPNMPLHKITTKLVYKV